MRAYILALALALAAPVALANGDADHDDGSCEDAICSDVLTCNIIRVKVTSRDDDIRYPPTGRLRVVADGQVIIDNPTYRPDAAQRFCTDAKTEWTVRYTAIAESTDIYGVDATVKAGEVRGNLTLTIDVGRNAPVTQE